ncbi:hypothetical protein ACTFIU_009042 [Dictyostelium citrinum]
MTPKMFDETETERSVFKKSGGSNTNGNSSSNSNGSEVSVASGSNTSKSASGTNNRFQKNKK